MVDGGVVVVVGCGWRGFCSGSEGGLARLPTGVAREAGGRFIYPLRLLFLFVLSVY
jgi:hypothetical protein